MYSLGVFISVVAFARGLDVSFIPNDENAPLPLSHNYREALRKLCTLVEGRSGGSLPQEIIEKKHIIIKMCQKLAADDRNVKGSFDAERMMKSMSGGGILLSILAAGGGYIAWHHRKWIMSLFPGDILKKKAYKATKIEPGGSGRGKGINKVEHRDDGQNMQQLLEAREARLKRFAEMNDYKAT